MMAKGGQVSGYFVFRPYKLEGNFYQSTLIQNEPPNSVVMKGLEGKLKGKKIVGYAATSKSTTILNYCKIGPQIIDYILRVGLIECIPALRHARINVLGFFA